MGKWNPAQGGPAVVRALGTVRAVTALSGLRAVLTLDQLAAYVGEELSSLDAGLRAGPVAAAQVERVTQGSYVGYRHPDAAWTTLPAACAAAGEGVEFARWFAGWLVAAGPECRRDAQATAKAVAAAARAAGRIALADRIDAVFSRGRRGAGTPVGRDPAAAPTSALSQPSSMAAGPSVSRLPAKTTAGILAGTAVLIVGAVAGVAALSGTGAAASGAPGGPGTPAAVRPASQPAASVASAVPPAAVPVQKSLDSTSSKPRRTS